MNNQTSNNNTFNGVILMVKYGRILVVIQQKIFKNELLVLRPGNFHTIMNWSILL